jgi:hypothetical protein
MLLLLLACAPELLEENCSPFDAGAGYFECDKVEICCADFGDEGTECSFVTKRERYPCPNADCMEIAEDLLCDVCDFDGPTADVMNCP